VIPGNPCVKLCGITSSDDAYNVPTARDSRIRGSSSLSEEM
jgi:hypothetical protein